MSTAPAGGSPVTPVTYRPRAALRMGLSLSLTLVLTAYICIMVGMEELKNSTERGVAGMFRHRGRYLLIFLLIVVAAAQLFTLQVPRAEGLRAEAAGQLARAGTQRVGVVVGVAEDEEDEEDDQQELQQALREQRDGGERHAPRRRDELPEQLVQFFAAGEQRVPIIFDHGANDREIADPFGHVHRQPRLEQRPHVGDRHFDAAGERSGEDGHRYDEEQHHQEAHQRRRQIVSPAALGQNELVRRRGGDADDRRQQQGASEGHQHGDTADQQERRDGDLDDLLLGGR